MAKIFDDIYAYVHPKGANCIVYAFKDGNEFDILDSGVGASIILRWLRKSMIKDGLDPQNIRNIFHCHGHFDHIGGDVFFQKISTKNKDKVNIYFPKLDAHRFKQDFSIMQSNFSELYAHFPDFPNEKIRKVKVLMRFAEKTIMKYKIPEKLNAFNDGDILSIGQRKAKIITTGGHTEGHSFLVFQDSDNILANSDATCINEFTSDFGGLLRAFHELDILKPSNLFGGHDAYCLGEEKVKKDIHDGRKRIEDMLRPILEQCKPETKINISSIAYKRIGSFRRIGVANTWAHMTPFCIGKHLEQLGVGKLELTPACIMYFNVSGEETAKDRIDILRNIGENKEILCTQELFKISKSNRNPSK